MRRDIFFIILIALGALAILGDVAFSIYVGIIVSQINVGLIFLPVSFNAICLGVTIANGVIGAYALLYLLILRRH